MNSEQLPLLPELADLPPSYPTSGLLPSQMLEDMVRKREITAGAPIGPDQIQPASLDLRLGRTAYRVRASFLPGRNATVQNKLQNVTIDEIDLTKPALLERGGVYIVPVQEELRLPDGFSARGNPKSTTGRLDIFTRLITDFGDEFEEIDEGYRGKLYVEVAPLTFPVVVREGTRLNQLRIRKGKPRDSDTMLRDLSKREHIVYSQDRSPAKPLIDEGLRLGVDLQGVAGSDVIGYRAKVDAPPIDLARVNHYEVLDYWEPVLRNANGSIVLERDAFYILTSTRKISIRPEYAAEMWPFDPSMGEFRIHYAGFFDPGFGWSSDEKPEGSHAVLEVRSHDVPLLLEHGQVVARLIFEELLARPAKLYGRGIGSSYQSQHLTLSKQFKR
jgi:dCTP deaminase